MIYSKPEITLVGAAIAEIHGTGKGGHFFETGSSHNDTISTYEADE